MAFDLIKDKATNVLLLFSVVSVVLWLLADSIQAFVKTTNPLTAFLILIFTTPFYYFIIIGLYELEQFRGLLASLFIAVAFDLISLAHFVNLQGQLLDAPAASITMDSILWKTFPFLQALTIFGFNLGTLILYVGIPITLMMIAWQILGWRLFNNSLKDNLGLN